MQQKYLFCGFALADKPAQFCMHSKKIINAMSVDVEDYFQVGAFEHTIAPADWVKWPCRIEANIELILSMFARHEIKATFFTLGWIAERYPKMVRSIVDAGHELASHGYGHQRATCLTATQFRDDVTRAKALLEDISGSAVSGYRAPSFSIGGDNLWALDVLAETGHRYSSSIYPIAHDHYGMPDAPRFPYRPEQCAALLEMPPTTVQWRGRNLPAAGGGFFRLLPYAASNWLIKRVNQTDQRPVMFYFHPWEIDPQQPRIPGASMKSRFRHYVNLDRMEAKLDRLCNDFPWGRADHVYAAELINPTPALAGTITK
jgi:polysaccharide deacetylase family protein (PEP-CTERM system associated)